METTLRGLLHQLTALVSNSASNADSIDSSALCQDLRQIIMQIDHSTSQRVSLHPIPLTSHFQQHSSHPPHILTYLFLPLFFAFLLPKLQKNLKNSNLNLTGNMYKFPAHFQNSTFSSQFH